MANPAACRDRTRWVIGYRRLAAQTIVARKNRCRRSRWDRRSGLCICRRPSLRPHSATRLKTTTSKILPAVGRAIDECSGYASQVNDLWPSPAVSPFKSGFDKSLAEYRPNDDMSRQGWQSGITATTTAAPMSRPMMGSRSGAVPELRSWQSRGDYSVRRNGGHVQAVGWVEESPEEHLVGVVDCIEWFHHKRRGSGLSFVVRSEWCFSKGIGEPDVSQGTAYSVGSLC